MNMKDDSKKISKKWWQSGGLIILCIFLAVYVIPLLIFGKTAISLISDSIRIRSMKLELSMARQRWNENKPYRYQVTVSSQKFFGDNVRLECNLEPVVIFENGEVVEGEYGDLCQDVYESVSVEKMFDQIEQELSNVDVLPVYFELEFDPHYGYVSNYFVVCHDEGLMSKEGCMRILPLFQKYSFDYKSFGFENFVVLQQTNSQ